MSTIKQIMGEIDSVDDELSERIRRVQAQLSAIVSIRVSLRIDDHLTIVFSKLDGSWCLWLDRDGQATPLLSAPREARAAAHEWIVALVASIPSQLQDAQRERRGHLMGYDNLIAMLVDEQARRT